MQDHGGSLEINSDACHDESTRRRQIITYSLQEALSPEELQRALHICDAHFTVDKTFTASEYLQCLKADLPHLQLDDDVRLRLLYACRLSMDKLLVAPTGEPPKNVRTEAADAPSQGHAKLFVDAIDAIQSGAQTRQARRHRTNLKGQYQRETPDMQTGELVIEDISQGGVKLRTLSTHQIKQHEVLRLRFRLHDESSSRVVTHIRVLWIEGNSLGGSFHNPQSLPHALVNFLQSQ